MLVYILVFMFAQYYNLNQSYSKWVSLSPSFSSSPFALNYYFMQISYVSNKWPILKVSSTKQDGTFRVYNIYLID